MSRLLSNEPLNLKVAEINTEPVDSIYLSLTLTPPFLWLPANVLMFSMQSDLYTESQLLSWNDIVF